MTPTQHPTPSSPARRHLHRPTLAIGLVVAAVVALVLGASPAGAGIGTPGGVGPTPPPPRLCVITPYGCHVPTSVTFLHTGQVVIASSTFPAGSSGTVRFTLRCADGFTKGRTTSIVGGRASAVLTSYGEHTVHQTCTATQGVAPDYETSTSFTPSTFDDLWPVTRPTFTNAARD